MEPVRHDLVLDVGNTRMKAALFGPAGMVRHTVLSKGDHIGLKAWSGPVELEAVALASVAGADPEFERAVAEWAPLLVVTGTTASPLRNSYGTPLTLGVDRLANALGAMEAFPGRPVIAIDLGTCITYDVMDGAGEYRGGLISPGLAMRARAMNAYSARLPLVEPGEAPRLVGRTTDECLAAGVHHGIRGELDTLIADLRHEIPGAAVVLTGGDALRFAKALKNGIFADPLLTLNGTHALLRHHRTLAAGHSAGPGRAPGAGAIPH